MSAAPRLTEVPKESPAEPAPARPSGLRRALPFLIVLLLAAVGTTWYLLHRGLEDTDDAQVDGDLIAVPARTTALVTAIHFQDNQVVKAGALLAELDDAPAKARLAQAEAELASATANAEAAEVEAEMTKTNAQEGRRAAGATLRGAVSGVTATSQQIAEADAQLAAAQANYQKAKLDLGRAQSLIGSAAIPRQQLDAAQAAYDSAQAAVDQARAHAASLRISTSQAEARVSEANARFAQASTVAQQIADAEAKVKIARARVQTATAQRDLAAQDLSYTKIYAPKDGVVSKRAINVGQNVQAGSAIVMLVPTGELWVTGNFKETQMGRMKVGQPATMELDAFDGRKLHGVVESFSAATGARFSLLPPDNATGNYTKIVQRMPVRIKLTEIPADLALRPGMSVDLVVDTRGR